VGGRSHDEGDGWGERGEKGPEFTSRLNLDGLIFHGRRDINRFPARGKGKSRKKTHCKKKGSQKKGGDTKWTLSLDDAYAQGRDEMKR